MKKLLFLLLITAVSYGQTYQNPTFGTVTTKTSPTVTNDPYVATTGTTGIQGKIAPVNLIIPHTPVNYTVPNLTIGSHLAGIDTRLGQISSTTAGLTQRIYFTADNTTVNSVIYFASNATSKGSTSAGSPPALVLADNTKGYFTKDLISIPQPAPTIGYAGSYSGNLTVSATPTPVATQQRFTVEVYRTDNLGTPIASGVSGAPVGDLGVTVVAILDSGIINLTAGSITNVSITGILTQNITINTGERLRYHVSAAKIGTGGGNVTFGVYYGSSYNSYYDVPVAIRTNAVLNDSGVTGVTATDALDNLNSGKIGGSLTANYIPKATGLNTQANSIISQSTTNNGIYIGNGSFNSNPLLGDPSHLLDISSSSNTEYLIRATNYSNTGGLANFHLQKARGTEGSPLAVLSGDFLASLGFRGYGTTGFVASSAAIQSIAEENFSDTNKGTSLQFQVTPLGATSPGFRITALKLQPDGRSDFAQKDGEGARFRANTASGNTHIRFYDSAGTARGYIGNFGSTNDFLIDNSLGIIRFTGTPIIFNSASTGRILMGTATDDGITSNRLQVNGNITASSATTSNHVVIKSQHDLKANIDSQTLTGDPKAPTPTAGDNDTSIATTAFVQNAIGTSAGFSSTGVAGTNVTSLSLFDATYIKIGNIVTVTIGVQFTATSASVASSFTASLPFNRSISSTRRIGVGSFSNSTTYNLATCQSNSTTTTDVTFFPTASGGYVGSISFQYNVNN